jgi:hypothetical protein
MRKPAGFLFTAELPQYSCSRDSLVVVYPLTVQLGFGKYGESTMSVSLGRLRVS